MFAASGKPPAVTSDVIDEAESGARIDPPP
jgi:hypothetical protein